MVTRGIVLRALDLVHWLQNLVDACVLECNGTPDTDLTIRTLATEFSELRLDTESYYTTGQRIAGFVPEISKHIIAGIKKPGVMKCLSDKLENYVELWKPDLGVWMEFIHTITATITEKFTDGYAGMVRKLLLIVILMWY